MSFWVKKIPRPGDRGRFKYRSVVGERLIRRSGQKTGESTCQRGLAGNTSKNVSLVRVPIDTQMLCACSCYPFSFNLICAFCSIICVCNNIISFSFYSCGSIIKLMFLSMLYSSLFPVIISLI